jgi:outer membrane protein assembly factor BamB
MTRKDGTERGKARRRHDAGAGPWKLEGEMPGINGYGRVVAASTLCFALLGCQTHESGPQSDLGTEARSGRTPRISDEVLRPLGLENILFYPPDRVDTPVVSASLAGEGLFIATVPVSERQGRLKFYNRANLNPDWFVELAEPLKVAPFVFKYPAGAGQKPNEVFFPLLDTVYCVDAKYGDIIWKQQVPFPVSTRVVADEENYFVGSDNGRIYGVRKRSSVDEWSYRTGNAVKASPAVEGASVFTVSSDGSVYKFSGRSGWVRGVAWKFDTGSRVTADPVPFSRWVVVGSTDYKLYCLETSDGSAHWSFQAEAPIEETPVVFSHGSNRETVYAINVDRSARSETRTLFAVKLTTGQEQWRHGGVRKVVSIGRKNVYVLEDTRGRERTLVALDLETGRERFRLPVTGFSFFPTNHAEHGRLQKERGRIYLVAEDGTIQVIGERL